MSELITPDELPRWVPGELTMDSAPLGWDGVRIRGYRYTALDVPIPGLHDYLVVAYQEVLFKPGPFTQGARLLAVGAASVVVFFFGYFVFDRLRDTLAEEV